MIELVLYLAEQRRQAGDQLRDLQAQQRHDQRDQQGQHQSEDEEHEKCRETPRQVPAHQPAHRRIKKIGDDAARHERQQDRAKEVQHHKKGDEHADPEDRLLPLARAHGLISAPASERAQRTR